MVLSPVYSYIGLGLSLASCEPGSQDRTPPNHTDLFSMDFLPHLWQKVVYLMSAPDGS